MSEHRRRLAASSPDAPCEVVTADDAVRGLRHKQRWQQGCPDSQRWGGRGLWELLLTACCLLLLPC